MATDTVEAVVQQLWAIEQIKVLKARYFRLMDLQQWDEWSDVFTPDCVMQLGESDDHILRGRDAIVAAARTSLAHRCTAHHGHTPEIALSSSQGADGVWAMAATGAPKPGAPADSGGGPLAHSYGHYTDTYELGADGRWRIGSTRLVTHLRVTDDVDALTELTGASSGTVISRHEKEASQP